MIRGFLRVARRERRKGKDTQGEAAGPSGAAQEGGDRSVRICWHGREEGRAWRQESRRVQPMRRQQTIRLQHQKDKGNGSLGLSRLDVREGVGPGGASGRREEERS